MYCGLFYCLFFLTIGDIKNAYGWDYKQPDEWKNEYQSCAGSRQSPINILLEDAKKDITSDLIWTNYYNIPDKMKLTNNGHSVQLQAKWNDKDDAPCLSSGPLNDKEYVFEQLHFHWGANDLEGSEHTIDGKGYPLEGHMVHWKKDYGSFGKATNYPDGVVVVAFFYNVSRDNKSNVMQNILDAVPSLEKVNSTTEIDGFPLWDFEVINDKNNFVSYEGSLTTPTCSEVVTWIISLTPSYLSHDQMARLRSIKLGHGDDHNNRPTQPLNGRIVKLYRHQ